MSQITDIHGIVSEWQRRNMRIYRYELRKKKIGDTEELNRTLNTDTRISGNNVESDFKMLVRGRFVDMGAGKGSKGGRVISGRMPKKWYSPTFFGRLNDLQGVLGFKIMEQSVLAIRKVKP